MKNIVDGLKPILKPLIAKYGPPESWPLAENAGSVAAPQCAKCNDQGWVNRPLPNPNPQVTQPIYKAFPCPACAPEEPIADMHDRLWRLSGISDAERERCTFDGFDLVANPGMQAAHDAAWEWGAGSGQPLLVLYSSVKGCGKTHLALAAANYTITRGISTRYEVVPNFLESLRATQRRPNDGEPQPPALETVRHRAERYPAVILDDLGANKGTEWADEQLFSVINERWRARARTLITTNVDPVRIEERIRSRLVDWQVSRVVACGGSDYRSKRQ